MANGNTIRVNTYGIRQSMARPAVKRAVNVSRYSAPDYIFAAKVGAAMAVGIVSLVALFIF